MEFCGRLRLTFLCLCVRCTERERERGTQPEGKRENTRQGSRATATSGVPSGLSVGAVTISDQRK